MEDASRNSDRLGETRKEHEFLNRQFMRLWETEQPQWEKTARLKESELAGERGLVPGHSGAITQSVMEIHAQGLKNLYLTRTTQAIEVICKSRRLDSTDIAYIKGKLMSTSKRVADTWAERFKAPQAESWVGHVPPIFGLSRFTEVANNHRWDKSEKKLILRLEEVSRNVADQHLHQQVKKSDSLPADTQVNFRAELDVLLKEIVALLKS